MKKLKNTIYFGMFLGSSIGWFFPVWLKIGNDFITKLFFSMIFAFLGIFLAYKIYFKFFGK